MREMCDGCVLRGWWLVPAIVVAFHNDYVVVGILWRSFV